MSARIQEFSNLLVVIYYFLQLFKKNHPVIIFHNSVILTHHSRLVNSTCERLHAVHVFMHACACMFLWVGDWATEPLSHWATEPLSHWATEPLSHWATEPLTQSVQISCLFLWHFMKTMIIISTIVVSSPLCIYNDSLFQRVRDAVAPPMKSDPVQGAVIDNVSVSKIGICSWCHCGQWK